MAEIALAVIAKLAEYVVDPLVRQGQYLFCAGNITKTLETEKQKLASTQEGVQTRVQEALNRTEKVVDAVNKWLVEVENHMDEVQKLEQRLMDNNSCFQGRCPGWRRYHLCRQMTKIIEATKNLNQISEFNPFSILAPLPEIEYFSSGNFVYFQSTKLASDQLLTALQDNNVHMIGLYGMGGSGKTTLVKEVGKIAKDRNLFDRVVFATVSQTLNIRKIQGELADDLSLGLHEESEIGRAKRLSVRLRSGEKILVILDDVWSMINLEDIGVFSEDCPAGCKILLTTRRQQVCNTMGCEEKIPLLLLSDEESFTLFQKHVSTVDESLSSLAQGIVMECKGLPIAIQAVGASLKGKSIEEWKEALRRLRDSKPVDVEPGVRDAFSCLQLSYDYLRSNETKSLFLMCCMYPEDTDIHVEDLFRIAVGLGMCEELDSLEAIRNKVKACINNLVDSCLLTRFERPNDYLRMLDIEKSNDYLRMHDTVRDVALWISSRENCSIVVNLENNMNVVEDGLPKDCYAFTSWCDRTSQFPQGLDAPKLEILLLIITGGCELSEMHFTGMGALRVLQIKSRTEPVTIRFSSSHNSMNLPTNIRTLCLENCELGDDLSWVVGLKKLEVLDLHRSVFKGLPQGLEDLRKLKLLSLPWINEPCFEIIGRCTQLKELYASEIRLSGKTLKVGKCFSNDTTFPRLRIFKLSVGNFDGSILTDYKYSSDFNSNNALALGELKVSALSPFIKYLLQKAENVVLHRLDNGGCKNIVPSIVQVVGGMNELTRLWLHSCLDLECLADATSHHIDLSQVETSFFPKLIKLEYLTNLKEIWRGPPLLCFFEKLQELYISNCSMLTSLFPKCVVTVVLLLQRLTIIGCSELKTIIEEDGDGANNEIISYSGNANLVFSNLRSLTIVDCEKLQHVFSNSCIHGLGQLEFLRIEKASQLKYAFGQHEDEHQQVQINLPVLKSLILGGLKNLLSISPKNFHSSWPCLRELNLVGCPNFRASCANIMVDSNKNVDNQLQSTDSTLLSFLNLKKLKVTNCNVEDILFALERDIFMERNCQNRLISPLNTLELEDLPELKLVWSGLMGTLSLENLIQFKVSGCHNLRTIFSSVILKCMPLLEYLDISNCNELEEIMSNIEVGEQYQSLQNAQSPQIWFPNLKRLQVDRCNKLKCLFSVDIDPNSLLENVFPNLRSLILEQVPSLKEFFQGLSVSNGYLPQLFGSKLEELRLGSFLDPKLILRAPSHTSKFLHLLTLELSECNKLKHVFGDGIRLPKLQNLTIRNCEELEEIASVDSEFQSCESLELECCNKLKCLFSTSSVTTLDPHLFQIKISKCAELEDLFRVSSDNVKEIVLPSLTNLWLKELPSLVNICKGFKLSAVNLYSIEVNKCPKFSSIMGATGCMGITQKLMEGYPYANNSDQLLDQLPHFPVANLHLKELELQKLSEISCICRTIIPSQNLSFQYLYYLNVHGCGKLKCILSMSVGGSLLHLAVLKILECEQVEEIIQEPEAEVHENTSNHNMQFSFPSLCEIEVRGCNKLKCLLKNVDLAMLPQLERIEVSEAAQMEELFPIPHTTDDSNMQQIELPSLRTLKLTKLPALTHLPKGFNINAPYLRKVEINECPKFDLSFQEATSTQITDESFDGEQ